MNLVNLQIILCGLNFASATFNFLQPSSSIIIIEDPKGVFVWFFTTEICQPVYMEHKKKEKEKLSEIEEEKKKSISISKFSR